MLLYKFTDCGCKILQKLKLKATPPARFNDPFEFRGRFLERLVTKKLARQYLQRNVKGLKHRGLKACASPETLEATLKTMRAEAIRHPSMLPEWTSRHWAVACFSERYDDLLMWSHYAKGHRGMVIGIESEGFIPSEHLIQVRYTFKPAAWFFEDKKSATKVPQTKWRGWRYEMEWRAMFPLGKCEKQKPKGSRPHRVVPLKPQQIKKVILGCLFPRSEQDIKSFLQKNGLGHVELLKAERDQFDYKLNFKRVL